jgi:hypothetical protein
VPSQPARGGRTDRNVASRRIQHLSEQRKKLFDAHYAGAIPLDLLKEEQDRIAAE